MSNMKIKFTHEYSSCEVYVISQKDQDDLDLVIPYEFMFDEDTHEYISDEMKALGDCVFEGNWNPKEFVRLYNKLEQDNWYCEIV